MSDKKYNIAVAKDRFDKNLKQEEITWSELIEKLRNPVVTNETVEIGRAHV